MFSFLSSSVSLGETREREKDLSGILRGSMHLFMFVLVFWGAMLFDLGVWFCFIFCVCFFVWGWCLWPMGLSWWISSGGVKPGVFCLGFGGRSEYLLCFLLELGARFSL